MKTRKFTLTLRENGLTDTMLEAEMRRMLKQLYGRRRASKKFNEFVADVLTKCGMESSVDAPSVYMFPGTALVLEVHQDDAYAGGTQEERTWLCETIHMVIKASPVLGPGDVYSYLTAARHYLDVGSIHIMPRESYTKDIPKELVLEECNPVPTPIVRTRRTEGLDTALLAPVDRTSYHRCVGIVRHLVRYRSDTAGAAHELSKSLSGPR